MNKRWTTVLLVVMFVLGLCIMLYPTVANYINTRNQSRAILTYNEEASRASQERFAQMIGQAQAFNQRLSEKGGITSMTEEETEEYHSLLNNNDDGIMGYIQIPKINVALMIAHTVDEDVLLKHVGHLPGSSLPVEGESVHCVLSAHRGLPSATLFSDLDQMAVGDTFIINVLDRVYQYQVDDISVILPEEVDALNIIPGKNYVTLMTCTPYGINSHRMLVRGELVSVINKSEEAQQQEQQPAAPFYVLYRDEIVLATAGVLALVFIALLLKRGSKKKESR